MRGYRFLLSRRWILFIITMSLATYAAWWLGEWQWHRLEGRKAANAIVRTNELLPPAPAGDILAAPGQTLDDTHMWRTVTATGTYDVAHTIIVRYREDDHSQAGVDVVVPLVTADGSTILVDRGFLATEASPDSPDDVPAPPDGEVTVTGYARADGTGGSTVVTAQSARAISSVAVSQATGLQILGGFVQATGESPQPGTPLAANDLPDLSNGPHFFYALQWWFFGLLAIFGTIYLAWDERRKGPNEMRLAKQKKQRQTNVPVQYQRYQKERRRPPSTGSNTPDTSDATGGSTKAAPLPGSAGRP